VPVHVTMSRWAERSGGDYGTLMTGLGRPSADASCIKPFLIPTTTTNEQRLAHSGAVGSTDTVPYDGDPRARPAV
jgi:hypothetical protein